MSAERERALARVDLGAVERNCRRLDELLNGTAAELCAVVKADGYGHGAIGCARAALAGGATRIAVVSAGEAEELRPEIDAEVPLMVMGALSGSEMRRALAVGAEIGVWDEPFRAAVSAVAAEIGTPARIHVKYDSGMGRLGNLDPGEVAEIAAASAADPNLELTGLWTHFATADEPGDDYFDEQRARFAALAEQLRAEHPELIVHAANSAATLREPAAHFDMVRCGIAIYGLDPFGDDPAAHGLEPALELVSYVAERKRFPRGQSAGYGRRWKAPEDTWVAVIPIGYGDGVRRALTNNAEVLIGGRRHPLVGTVSMDNITVDLGPETDVEPGAEVVLIGAQGEDRLLAEEMAERIETINYEITCGITPRVPRRQVG